MDFLVQGLVTGWIAAFIGVQPAPTPNADIEWSCGKPNWTARPVVSGGYFTGTVEVACKFTAVGAGGFPNLKNFLVAETPKQAKAVHSGPIAESYAGLPSTYFDLTVEEESEGETVTIRGDHHIATDESKRLVIGEISKSVSGTGQAGLLRKIDVVTTIDATATENAYTAHAVSSFKVQKPGLVPAGIFKNQIVSKVEAELPVQEKAVLEQVGANL